MSKLVNMIQKLEAAGIDTSQFTVVLGDGTKIVPNGNYVEDTQLNNKTFRRWITAQTFRMLYESSYNKKKRLTEYGWYNYLKNNYDYMYQFKVIMDELKVLAKLERNDPEAFEERKLFFTKEVILATCEDCLNKLKKVCSDGNVDLIHMKEVVTEIKCYDTYKAIRTCVDRFVHLASRYKNRLKGCTKCSLWIDAYKGSGAYYSLQNMILYHGCKLPRIVGNKEYQYMALREALEECSDNGEVWRLHYLLKETIKWNHFDLATSIRKHQ